MRMSFKCIPITANEAWQRRNPNVLSYVAIQLSAGMLKGVMTAISDKVDGVDRADR